MVVTVVLSGIPRYVSLIELARNLDQLFDECDLGGFNVRGLPPHPKTKKRRVALDFSSGYDAISAQEKLNNYRYELTDGTHHTLRAKITRDPDLIIENMSKRNHVPETALVPYSNRENTDRRSSEESDSLEEQYVCLKKKLLKLEKKKKLSELKKKIKSFKSNLESRSDSSSSSDSPKLSRTAIKSKYESSSPPSLYPYQYERSCGSREQEPRMTKRSRHHSRDSRSTSTETYRKIKKSRPCDDSSDHKKTSKRAQKYQRSRSNERPMSPAAKRSSYKKYCDESLSATTRRSPNKRLSPNSRWTSEYRRSPNVRRSLYDGHSPELRRLQSPKRQSPSKRQKDSSEPRKSLDYTYSLSPRQSPSKIMAKKYTDPRRSTSSSRSGPQGNEIIYVDRSRWEQQSTSKDDFFRTRIGKRYYHHSPTHYVKELDDSLKETNPVNFTLRNLPTSDDGDESDSSSTTQKINIVISVNKNKTQVETPNSEGVLHKPIKEEPYVKEEDSTLKIKIETDNAEYPDALKNSVASAQYDRSYSNSAVQIKTEHEIINLSSEVDENSSDVVQTLTQNDTMKINLKSVKTENTTRGLKNKEKELSESDIDDAINELANLVSTEVSTNEAKNNDMSQCKILTDPNKELPVKNKKVKTNKKSKKRKPKRKKPSDNIKRISENPKFVLSIHIIMRKMLSHISHLNLDEDLKAKYLAVTKLVLRYRIQVLLKNCQDYLDKNQVVELYRKKYPLQEDKELVENIIADIHAGKYADIQPEEKKKKKKVQDENNDPNLKELAGAVNDPNTNGDNINRNFVEPDVNNSDSQFIDGIANENKDSSQNSCETLKLNKKIENNDVSDNPKTTQPQKPKLSPKNKSSSLEKAAHIEITREKIEKDQITVGSSKSESTPSIEIVKTETVLEDVLETHNAHKKSKNKKNKTQDKEHKKHKTDSDKSRSKKNKTESTNTTKNPKISSKVKSSDLSDESSQVKKVEGCAKQSENEDDDLVIINSQVPIIDLSVNENENNDPNLKELAGAVNDPNTNGDNINRNFVEPDVNNSDSQFIDGIANENKDSSQNSCETLKLNKKIENNDVSDNPKTTQPQKPKLSPKNKSSSLEKAAHIEITREKIEKDQITVGSSKSESTPSIDIVKTETVLEDVLEKSNAHKKSKNKKDKTQDKEHKKHKTDGDKSRSKKKKTESTNTTETPKISSKVKSSDLSDESSQVKKVEGCAKQSENEDDDLVIINSQVPIIDLSVNENLNNKEEKSIEPLNKLTCMVEKVFKKEKGVPDKGTDLDRQSAESFKNTLSKYERKNKPKNEKDKKRSEKVKTKEKSVSPKADTITHEVTGENLNLITPKVEHEPEETSENIEKFVSLLTTITKID